METTDLTPDKSFEIITRVINEAKSKFEESGFIYVLWGSLICIASIAQFVLLKNELYSINYYPYFLMPVGGIISAIYYSRQNRLKGSNLINKVISAFWIALGLNMMILGFFFFSILKANLIPMILILMGIGTLGSGVSIKSKILLLSGVLINLSGLACFYIEWINHPLLMGIVSAVAVLIPGIILMIKSRKNNV